MKKTKFTEYLKSFDLKTLFNELGWDNFANQLPVAVNEELFVLQGVAEKRGFVVLECQVQSPAKVPVSNIRKQIEGRVVKSYFEHLVIYTDSAKTQQIWQLAVKEENKPRQIREIIWHAHQDSEILFQRLRNVLFTLDEEDKITIIDVKQRISENFARNTEQVTKKFYDQFKKQHTAFLDFIRGIDDHIANKENSNKQWYASLMLNRLMFCYFIQKKGFLDQDVHYLSNKLWVCRQKTGDGNFYSFYRSFLLELFHDGLGKPQAKRKEKLPVELGKIPYLNGGLFDVHELERQFSGISIDDEAFKRIFDFFDYWNWHLDTGIDASGRDINPDVIGYIFEKYINDRAAMGAYYTKEDITDYIGKNTILPFLFDETERHYPGAFKPDGELWQFLKQSGDAYIYDAVKHGVPQSGDLYADLPDEVKGGFVPGLEQQLVGKATSPHLWEIRKAWNQQAPQEIALPTEIYRELIERRKRYAEVKQKIANGEITHINDFITYNLNIRQFIQDFLQATQDPEFVKCFFKAIQKITILDPTGGSGAFLFAALNILEPLYETCIDRIENFVEEAKNPDNYANLPEHERKVWHTINHKDSWFHQTLSEINSGQHYNRQYYIYKSIILNNLFGVDLMKEAVEIAKLRLFLKLVATVDMNPRKENFGLEPLPDIDFNIRAGNTLVGFATENELFETIQKKDGLFAQAALDNFKEDCELVGRAYNHFQDSQLITDQGTDNFRQAKELLNKQLNELNHKLNIYLAINYGIDASLKPKEFEAWLASHQPFHWFAEFYQIVAINKGFDVIIGNPPYVELKVAEKNYKIVNSAINTGGNLHSMVCARALQFVKFVSKIGFIVPVAVANTDRMEDIRKKIVSKGLVWISNYAIRPGKLFSGAEQRLSIYIVHCDNKNLGNIWSSKYYKWNKEERPYLFDNLALTNFHTSGSDIWYKYPNQTVKALLETAQASTEFIGSHCKGTNSVYYKNTGIGYYIVASLLPPDCFINGIKTSSSRETAISFQSTDLRNIFHSLISSSLFFLYYHAKSNCRDLNPSDITQFQFPTSILKEMALVGYSEKLQSGLMENSWFQIRNQKQTGEVKIQSFTVSSSKPIIDQIDTVLAQHYGFTEGELDFIINYDIKYRMGKALFGEVEDLEEEEE
ncbi:MAG: hypothetical protein WCP85_09975 [Mariniphaga sp.]